MGNRAIIKGFAADISVTNFKVAGVYLHNHGEYEDVFPILMYCKMKGYRNPVDDWCYAMSRFCQVAANYIGGSTGIGLVTTDYYTSPEEVSSCCIDNGFYEINKDWFIENHYNIVGEIVHDKPMSAIQLFDAMLKIDLAQPKCEWIGSSMIMDWIENNYNPEDFEEESDKVDIERIDNLFDEENRTQFYVNKEDCPLVLEYLGLNNGSLHFRFHEVCEGVNQPWMVRGTDFFLDEVYDLSKYEINKAKDALELAKAYCENEACQNNAEWTDYPFKTTAVKILEDMYPKFYMSDFYESVSEDDVFEWIREEYDITPTDSAYDLLRGVCMFCRLLPSGNDTETFFEIVGEMLAEEDLSILKDLDIVW